MLIPAEEACAAARVCPSYNYCMYGPSFEIMEILGFESLYN